MPLPSVPTYQILLYRKAPTYINLKNVTERTSDIEYESHIPQNHKTPKSERIRFLQLIFKF